PLAALAQTQAQLHERLPELTPAAPELEAAWRQAAGRWPRAWSWARRRASSVSVLLLRCLNFQASLAVLAPVQARPRSAQRSWTQPASRQTSLTTPAGRW